MTIPDSNVIVNTGTKVKWASKTVAPVVEATKIVSRSPRRRPPYKDMVVEAVKTLKERGGTSLPAIKKYLFVTYEILSAGFSSTSRFIAKAINAAVEEGSLVKIKGKGAFSWYKLGKLTEKSKRENVKAQSSVKKAKAGESVKFASLKKKNVTSEIVVAKKGALAPKLKPILKKSPVDQLPGVAASTSENFSFASKTGKISTKERKPAAKGSKRFEDLILEAVKHLKNRNGSSLPAIKKYLRDIHQINVVTASRFIIIAVNTALESGALVRISGKGVSGSFKLGKPTQQVKVKPTLIGSKAGNDDEKSMESNKEAAVTNVLELHKKEPASENIEVKTKQSKKVKLQKPQVVPVKGTKKKPLEES